MQVVTGKRSIESIEQSIEGAGYFMLRTPLLPFDDFLNWSFSGEALSHATSITSDQDRERRWQERLAILREKLRAITIRPEVQHALFIASPSLLASLDEWYRNPDGKKGLQTERALVRYFSRMCGRSTPFGLFSGCSVGRLVQRAELQGVTNRPTLASQHHYKTFCRLDFGYLSRLTAGLRRLPAIEEKLRYWCNTSLHKIGDDWHYIETAFIEDRQSHHLVKLETDQLLETVITHAANGAVIAELVEAILALPAAQEFTEDEVYGYVLELIRADVLVSSLSPLITGGSALDDLVTQLSALSSEASTAKTLSTVRDHLNNIQRRGVRGALDDYRVVIDLLKDLPAPVDPPRLFQVDLTKAVDSPIPMDEVLKELEKSVQTLCSIDFPQEPEQLDRFRNAFRERYDRAWIPLLEALDEESGIALEPIGDKSALLKDLFNGIADMPDKVNTFGEVLVNRLHAWSPKQGIELALDSLKWDRQSRWESCLPDSFEIQFSVVASTIQDIRDGNFTLNILGTIGPPGTRFQGRFCYADEMLKQSVQELLRSGERRNPDAIHAEIVHVPGGRVGNVIHRPVLGDFEITFLGRSGVQEDRQIPASDLLVSIADDGTILLYSDRLKRRVVPRLSNAHSYRTRGPLLSVYRFLCLLQHQGKIDTPLFRLGILEDLEFIPRLRIGRTVLACARWRLTSSEILTVSKRSRQESFEAVQELRRQRDLPRWILLVEFDNTLPVDLDNPLSVDAMVHVLRRADHAIVREMYPAPDALCITGPEGRFCHEFVLPVVRKNKAGARQMPSLVPNALLRETLESEWTRRAVIPGNDWLYLKLYGGLATLEEILLDIVPVALTEIHSDGLSPSWFFLRYADPEQHLRLRFREQPLRLLRDILPKLSAKLTRFISSRRIWKLTIDTYDREVERYGGFAGLNVSEDLFYIDSDAVVDLLRTIKNEFTQDTAWRYALLGVDRLLNDFDVDLPSRKVMFSRLREAWFTEFGVGRSFKTKLDSRFREHGRSLTQLLHCPQTEADCIANKIFERRSRRVVVPIQKLRQLDSEGKLSAPVSKLLESFMHMHINRMIRSAQRTHELVLYDYLYRLYAGQLARGRRSLTVSEELCNDV